MSKTTYMYGQEAQGAIKEREPYWDYMARRGAGKTRIAPPPENIVNKHENIAMSSDEVYPVREDVPAELWGKPVVTRKGLEKNAKKVLTRSSDIQSEHSSVADMVHHSRDMVNHPSHYNKGIETSEYIKSWEMNWNQANVVKYVTRYNLKSKDINIQIQDLMKAKWYLEDLIKELEEHNPY